jgi:hypothetical protein
MDLIVNTNSVAGIRRSSKGVYVYNFLWFVRADSVGGGGVGSGPIYLLKPCTGPRI